MLPSLGDLVIVKEAAFFYKPLDRKIVHLRPFEQVLIVGRDESLCQAYVMFVIGSRDVISLQPRFFDRYMRIVSHV